MGLYKVQHIHYSVGSKLILQDVDASFITGQFHVLAGPNGAGKTSLLKILSGELKPQQGSVWYNDTPIAQLSKLALAQQRTVMSQHTELPFPLSVEEVVMMGRYPYFNFRPSATDLHICQQAMAQLQLTEMVGRNYLTLSGGEKQRVQFARALAQIGMPEDNEYKLLLLDEAVSNLDVQYQHQLLQHAKSLCAKGITVVAILHELNLALQYADQLFFMNHGRISANAANVQAVTPTLLETVFGVPMELLYTDEGRPVVFVR